MLITPWTNITVSEPECMWIIGIYPIIKNCHVFLFMIDNDIGMKGAMMIKECLMEKTTLTDVSLCGAPGHKQSSLFSSLFFFFFNNPNRCFPWICRSIVVESILKGK